MDHHRVDRADLHRFASALLSVTDAPEEVADTVAESLVAANLRGHPSHGIQLIPDYIEWAEHAHLEPEARGEVVAEREGAFLVDGNHGFGHPVAREATERAMDALDDRPAVSVGIRKATHIGRVGWFAEQAAAAGYGFVAFTNMTSGEPVAPAGSAQRRFGTNPLTFALPSFDALDYPVMLDIATSQVAYGKINVSQMAGEGIDAGWTVDADGEPVLDADRFNEDGVGAMAPLGGQTAGYKGTGLMLMAELFAATWSDSPVTPQPDARYENSAYFTLFDPLAFTTREAHEARILALQEYLDETDYSASISPGTGTDADRAYLPGRQEHVTKRAYERAGIPVPVPICETLVTLARERGIDAGAVDPLVPG